MTLLVDNTMDLIYMYLPYYSVLNGGQAVALFGVLHHWSIWVASAIVFVDRCVGPCILVFTTFHLDRTWYTFNTNSNFTAYLFSRYFLEQDTTASCSFCESRSKLKFWEAIALTASTILHTSFTCYVTQIKSEETDFSSGWRIFLLSQLIFIKYYCLENKNITSLCVSCTD